MQFFKRFEANWVEIDKNNYQMAPDDSNISDVEEITSFAQALLD